MSNEKIIEIGDKKITVKNTIPSFSSEQEKDKNKKYIEKQLYSVFKKY